MNILIFIISNKYTYDYFKKYSGSQEYQNDNYIGM